MSTNIVIKRNNNMFIYFLVILILLASTTTLVNPILSFGLILPAGIFSYLMIKELIELLQNYEI
jgi:hypothetical protein